MHGYQTGQHAERIHAALEADAAAKSALVASWRRSSSLHGLDPGQTKLPRRLTQGEITETRQKIDALVHAAQASMDRLYLAVGGVGCCVLLADRNGIPVDRRGASADDDIFDRWGLWTGAVWSEESEGTNGIGTCLIESRALTIHRDQHFFARNTQMSCMTAPVYDHEGNLAAALDVSSCRDDLTEGFANLIAMAVSDAARRIEADNFRLAFPKARVLVVPTPGKGASALVAVDGDDLVVGATRGARLHLGITSARLKGSLPAADLLGETARTREELGRAERGAVHRALVRAGGNVSAAANALGISRATLHRKLKALGIRRQS